MVSGLIGARGLAAQFDRKHATEEYKQEHARAQIPDPAKEEQTAMAKRFKQDLVIKKLAPIKLMPYILGLVGLHAGDVKSSKYDDVFARHRNVEEKNANKKLMKLRSAQ